MVAGQTTLRASAAASDARGVATGARRMKLRVHVLCTNNAVALTDAATRILADSMIGHRLPRAHA